MYIVEVNMPNLAKGTMVEIDGLGFYENGVSEAVSADQAEAYRAKHIHQETTTDKEGRLISRLVPAPTLLQAFRKTEGVTVRRMTKEESQEFYKSDDGPQDVDDDNDEHDERSEGDDQ